MTLIWTFIVVLGVTFLDMLTKGLTEALIPLGGSVTVIEGVLNFTYVRNSGAAFSILAGQTWFFITTGAIASIIMVAFLWKNKFKSKVLQIGVSLMLAGTLGNLYDRIAFGEVRDMVELKFVNFAIFNLADMALCIGVALVIIFIIFIYKDKSKKDKKSQQTAPTGDGIDQEKEEGEVK